MRAVVGILLIICLTPLAAADQFIFDDTLYEAADIELAIQVSGGVEWSGSASSVQAKLFYYPKLFDGQQVLEATSRPQASQQVDYLLFSWQEPSSPASFTRTSRVESSYLRPKISERIEFPYRSVPPELDKYLQSEEIIMITDDIRDLAEDIIGAETDAVRVAFELGSWVKDNIRYDLNSVTAEASMTSQWVLENGEGVCDELTSLFIAMLRSQGVPARFVSGVAYTNLEELDTPWGPHGWAEVWFPDVGWVPYDVTYGQYGWVDATHVAFMKSADALSSAAEYSLRGRDAQLSPTGIQRDVELASRSGQVPTYAEYEVSSALEKTGLGGYNRIDATLSNQEDFYVSTELFLGRTSRLSAKDYSRSVLLAPGEQRTVSWLVEIDDSLESGFEYTFPVAVHTNDNRVFRTEFKASSGAYVASREELEVGLEAPTAAKSFLSCDAPRNVPAGESFEVSCSAQDATICMQGSCSVDELVLTHRFADPGVYNVIATANGQRRVLTITAQDQPRYELVLSAPETVGFAETKTVNVTLLKQSVSAPRNVDVVLRHALHTQRWEVAELSEDVLLQLEVRGEQLHSGDNRFVVVSGDQRVEASTQVVARGWVDRVLLFLNRVTAFVAAPLNQP